MPGKKARKNAQPSPTRAPAGRDPMGRRSWPGRGGRDAGRGLYRGRVSPSTRGLVWSAPLHVLSGRLVEVLGGFIQDRGDGEGPRFGIGRQRSVGGAESQPHLPCPGHGEEKCRCGCQPPGESHCHGGWGRGTLLALPVLPASPKTGLFLRGPGLGGPRARRYHTLHPQR